MREWRASKREIERQRRQWLAVQPESDTTFEIFPTNVTAFRVFIALRTKWELPGAFGGRCTVPSTEIESTMHMMGIADTTDTFNRVSILIDAARPILIEKIERERKANKRV